MSLTYGEARTAEQKQVDSAIMQRVKNGIAALEARYGPNWVDRIDVMTLDLTCPTQCVLGQVAGWYPRGLDDLYGPYYQSTLAEQETRTGFAVEHGFYTDGDNEAWDELQATWERVLTPMVTQAQSS